MVARGEPIGFASASFTRLVDEELLGELDDGAVGPADMMAGATLRAQTRDDVDDQIDLVRKQWIEGDEILRVVRSGKRMSALSRVWCRWRVCSALESNNSRSVFCPAAFFERIRWLVTSEMSEGSRWT
jgi:hypothetical protein